MYFDDELYVKCGFDRTFHTKFYHNFLEFIIPSTTSSSSSEMLANFYQTTQRNIPEDSHLHTRCRENLKSHYTGSVQLKLHAFLTSALRDMQLSEAPATLPPDKKAPVSSAYENGWVPEPFYMW
jgi:hypothetical protein